jgi:hypothetical protein
MKEFTLKNYPAGILITIVLSLSVIIEVGIRLFQEQPLSLDSQLFWPVLRISGVSTLLIGINKYFVFDWYLKLLGLTLVKGHYSGHLESSFHIDDDVTKPHITMRMEVEIAQNINGVKIFGKVYPNEPNAKHTSSFESEWANLEKLENGNFIVEYRYDTKKEMLHPLDPKYGLNSHTGWAKLIYDPNKKTLSGFYVTLENKSHGEIHLSINKKR